MAVKESTQILMEKMRIGLLDLKLVGTSPLIVHRWSEKAKKEMLDKQMKKAKQAKEAKDPQRDFEESLYKTEDGRYCFPAVGFKSAAVTACTSLGGVTKVAARQAFHVVGEWVIIEGSEPRMREDMVRVGMDTADIRYRGEFDPWFALLTVEYNANFFSAEQIVNLFDTAGFAVGVGEWRPEKDGLYGRFKVDGVAAR